MPIQFKQIFFISNVKLLLFTIYQTLHGFFFSTFQPWQGKGFPRAKTRFSSSISIKYVTFNFQNSERKIKSITILHMNMLSIASMAICMCFTWVYFTLVITLSMSSRQFLLFLVLPKTKQCHACLWKNFCLLRFDYVPSEYYNFLRIEFACALR